MAGTTTPDAMYRDRLPQLDADRPFLADAGLETELVFHHGFDLPAFASFVLLDTDRGRDRLQTYYRSFVDLARRHQTGVVLEATTWRANVGWIEATGYALRDLERVNHQSIELLAALRDEADVPVVVSGCIGPMDDGYSPAERLAAAEAEVRHRVQIDVLADTEADCVTAMTMTYADEAIGVARAAAAAGVPSVISFTVETDGRLPSGETLGEAVRAVDDATGAAPAYYMINCAHPTHVLGALDGGWTARVRGLRANASTCSHAELDEAETLDEGDPDDLAARYGRLADRLDLAVVGGCCGTDLRHVAAIADVLLPVPA
jgi:homocysteine S-methyltransferase